MKENHPARAHVIEALRAVREGRHLDAQHAIQNGGYACSMNMYPPDLGHKGDQLRVMEVHCKAAWMPDPAGGGQHVRRPAGEVDVAPTQGLRDILAGTAVHA